MEELRKLEEAQRMLDFMEEREFQFSHLNDPSSRRFIANLLLFLIQPCAGIDVADKCKVIGDILPNISTCFLEEASLEFNQPISRRPLQGKAEQGYGESARASVSDGKECWTGEMPCADMVAISLDSMQRANSTLEDFCRSYFMFHGMDVNKPQSVFKYLPILAFTESYIYQMDSLNEKVVHMSASNGMAMENCGLEMQEGEKRWFGKIVDVLNTDPFNPLVRQLETCGLMNERIRKELKFGEEYWTLERKLCSALLNQKKILVEDVMRAIHLKSFDYRVLNLILYELTGEKVNSLHMEFLSISEFLVEVSDDLHSFLKSLPCVLGLVNWFITFLMSSVLLIPDGHVNNCRFDYEDDVIENNFNVLRMFVNTYGASAAPAMLAKCIAEAEEKYAKQLQLLDSDLSFNYQKRCEEATKEGGKVSGHPLGSWTIPPVIADEELYRQNLKKSSTRVLF